MSLDHYQPSLPTSRPLAFCCSECHMTMLLEQVGAIISNMKGFDWYRIVYCCPECGHHETITVDPKDIG